MSNPYEPPSVQPASPDVPETIPKSWWLLSLVIVGGFVVALMMTFGVSVTLLGVLWLLLWIISPLETP